MARTKADLQDIIVALEAKLKAAESAQPKPDHSAEEVAEAHRKCCVAEDTYKTAVAEHKEDLAKYDEASKDAYTKLGEAASEIEALKAAADKPRPLVITGTPIGTLQIPTGTLVLGDTKIFETRWKSAQLTQSGYVVDIVGPHAEQLALRNRGGAGGMKIEELCDGTWRVHTNGQREGLAVCHDAELLIAQQGWSDKCKSAPGQGFVQRAIDAARGTGAGIVVKDGYGAITGKTAQIVVSNHGNKRIIHLIIS